MKVQIESTTSSASALVRKGDSGRIHKSKKSKRSRVLEVPMTNMVEEESAQVSAYLDKLQELVPFMPKNKRLTNLEVISNTIDYINELRETLGFPLCDDEDYDSSNMFKEGEDEMFHEQTTVISDNSHFLTNNIQQEDLIKISDGSCQKLYHTQNRQPLCAIPSPNGNSNEISPKNEEYLLIDCGQKPGLLDTRY